MFITPDEYTHVVLNTSTGEAIFVVCELDAARLKKKMMATSKKNTVEVQTKEEYEFFAEGVQV